MRKPTVISKSRTARLITSMQIFNTSARVKFLHSVGLASHFPRSANIHCTYYELFLQNIAS